MIGLLISYFIELLRYKFAKKFRSLLALKNLIYSGKPCIPLISLVMSAWTYSSVSAWLHMS